MFDHEDLKGQARRSRRQLRAHTTALASICAELEELRQQAGELRSEADEQLAQLQQCMARVEKAGADRDAWQRLQHFSAVPIQMDLQVEELKQVVGARDYLVRRRCRACQRPFLTRRSRRTRQYCSDRCRVWAFRKRRRAG